MQIRSVAAFFVKISLKGFLFFQNNDKMACTFYSSTKGLGITMRYRRQLALLLLECILWISCTGCGRTAGEENATDSSLPQIIVGCDYYPPYNFKDENGNPEGIDIELATEAFQRMGYTPVFQYIDWEQKKELVENGTVDCIWSSFTMTGREDQYQWAGPYMVSRQVVAVNPGSEIRQLDDLTDKVVAVQSTTKPEQLLLEAAQNGLPQVREVYSLENRELLYTSLGKGYVDAIAAHEISIRQYMKDYDVEYRILPESLQDVGLGVAFSREDDRGLAEELTQVLEEMRADGTSAEILGKYLTDAESFLEVESLEK